jgi:urease beta subunit
LKAFAVLVAAASLPSSVDAFLSVGCKRNAMLSPFDKKMHTPRDAKLMMAIDVNILAGKDGAESLITATGTQVMRLKDAGVNGQKLFGLGPNSQLIAACGKYFGKPPTDAFLGSTTPWGDLYETYGWQQVEVVMIPLRAEVTSVSSDPVIVATKTYSNKSQKYITVSADVTDAVDSTASTSWSSTATVGMSNTIAVEVGFEGIGKISGSSTISFEETNSVGSEHSKSLQVSTGTGVVVELEPGQSAEVNLCAFRGTMKARVYYRQYLTGLVAVNYYPQYKDHSFYGLSAKSLATKSSIETVQDIEVGFYSDTSLTVTDSATKEVMLDAQIVNYFPAER